MWPLGAWHTVPGGPRQKETQMGGETLGIRTSVPSNLQTVFQPGSELSLALQNTAKCCEKKKDVGVRQNGFDP